ncbi:hypothetical protein SETIT_1G208700v2 [Setaria italica]|uniref:Uncharacterized protein n=1 Tax=Setaria italica TaxID=4555 RepID=A0A368PNC8_SETIT|nr:hypothetical protein SETIT_1G208700v2 [Setaria italica]
MVSYKKRRVITPLPTQHEQSSSHPRITSLSSSVLTSSTSSSHGASEPPPRPGDAGRALLLRRPRRRGHPRDRLLARPPRRRPYPPPHRAVITARRRRLRGALRRLPLPPPLRRAVAVFLCRVAGGAVSHQASSLRMMAGYKIGQNLSLMEKRKKGVAAGYLLDACHCFIASYV